MVKKQDRSLENGANAEDALLRKLQGFTNHSATVDLSPSTDTEHQEKPVSRSQRKERLKQPNPEQPIPATPEALVKHTTSSRNAQVKGSMPKKKKDEYQEWLKQDFSNLFETLELKDRQKHYLKSRWLDQVLWMEGRANRSRDWHYKLRLTTIIGGVIIPALVSLNFSDSNNPQLKQALSISTFVLSQLVAISAASDQFFNHGDGWRHYRRSVETMKTQGWQFFELSGPYQACKTHDEAFNLFAGQVEDILQKDVEVYATQVAQTQKEDKDEAQRSNGRVENSRVPAEMVQRT